VIDSGVRDVKLETIAVETTGASLAAEVGRAVLTLQQPGGASATAEGKYVVVWKEDGGEWKLHADIWNMNA
jgi:ketosteroid isomerase-like protein